jgi:hypothetical protein
MLGSDEQARLVQNYVPLSSQIKQLGISFESVVYDYIKLSQSHTELAKPGIFILSVFRSIDWDMEQVFTRRKRYTKF